MESLKISIITVVYNAKTTIEKTIKSVLDQSYKNVEYIIIDGGSTDGTVEIIERHRSVIDFIISEPDRGLYDAMNKGIDISNGDIIGILNADDVFFDEYVLSNISKFFTEFPKIDAAVGNIIQFDTEGKLLRYYSSQNWTPFKLKFGFMPPHPSIFFKRILFETFDKYRIDFKSGADYELIVRYFIIHRISWAYHNITTTSMLIGGISSSGLKSYNLISMEIIKALKLNNIKFCKISIYSRVVWKLIGYLHKPI